MGFPQLTVYIRGVDIPMDARFVNLVLGMSKIHHEPHTAKLRETDMTWLRNTLVEEKYWEEVSQFTSKGLINHYYSPEGWRWLTLIGQRVHPSGNLTYMTYPRALVVVYIIGGIPVYMGEMIMAMWMDLYHGSKKSPFLLGLVYVLCMQVVVPLDDTNYEVEND